MTAKELYEKYAGRRASCNGNHGIVCGYGSDGSMSLLIAVDETDDGEGGWPGNFCRGTFITHKENGLGYWWVLEEDIMD